MKHYSFNLSKVIYDKVFPSYRLKTKAHIIEVLMEVTRFILLQNDPEFIVSDNNSKGKVVLYIDKMSRLFFFSENKYYSIVFPFHCSVKDDQYKIFFQSNINVTPKLISKVISTIKCDQFKAQCSLDFVEPICNAEDDCGENFWELLRELLLMEDGYIRYDVDKENYDKAVEKGEEHKHPLNHYDIFHSNNATFKVGLWNTIYNEDFINLLNINTDCNYLTKPSTK
jgi:hypothetical protein